MTLALLAQVVRSIIIKVAFDDSDTIDGSYATYEN